MNYHQIIPSQNLKIFNVSIETYSSIFDSAVEVCPSLKMYCTIIGVGSSKYNLITTTDGDEIPIKDIVIKSETAPN